MRTLVRAGELLRVVFCFPRYWSDPRSGIDVCQSVDGECGARGRPKSSQMRYLVITVFHGFDVFFWVNLMFLIFPGMVIKPGTAGTQCGWLPGSRAKFEMISLVTVN